MAFYSYVKGATDNSAIIERSLVWRLAMERT